MPSLTLSDEQVIALVEQLPPERKREVLLAIATGARPERETRITQGETELRRLSAERGLSWDRMTEDEREAFVDLLLHEDRNCS